MGDRYILDVTCPACGRVGEDVPYAPTCGFTEHKCPCGHVVDLEELTGISYEDASNRVEIEGLSQSARDALSCGVEAMHKGPGP